MTANESRKNFASWFPIAAIAALGLLVVLLIVSIVRSAGPFGRVGLPEPETFEIVSRAETTGGPLGFADVTLSLHVLLTTESINPWKDAVANRLGKEWKLLRDKPTAWQVEGIPSSEYDIPSNYLIETYGGDDDGPDLVIVLNEKINRAYIVRMW